jgi:hypothetical protein
MTKGDPPAGNRGAKVDTGSGDSRSVPPLVVVADEHPEQADAEWLTTLLLVGAA